MQEQQYLDYKVALQSHLKLRLTYDLHLENFVLVTSPPATGVKFAFLSLDILNSENHSSSFSQQLCQLPSSLSYILFSAVRPEDLIQCFQVHSLFWHLHSERHAFPIWFCSHNKINKQKNHSLWQVSFSKHREAGARFMSQHNSKFQERAERWTSICKLYVLFYGSCFVILYVHANKWENHILLFSSKRKTV